MEKSRLMIGLKLVFSLVICQFAGLLGSIFTTPNIGNWYAYLNKPIFSPPNWIFAPVWTFLYLTMGLSLFLVWVKAKDAKEINLAFIFFIIQLMLNIAWSLVFFGLNSILGGVIVVILLIAAVLFTIIKFFKISEIAGILLIPYLLWVSFASILNIAIYFLNK